MNLKKLGILAGMAMLAATAFVIGCSSGSSSTPNGAAAPGGEAPGGEAAVPGGGEVPALVAYSAPDGSYSLQVPQGWARGAGKGGTVQFTGTDAFLLIDIQTNSAASALAFATADKATVAKDYAGYKEISLSASPDVKNAQVLTFEWDAANSVVTGKPVRAQVDRYYIPVSGGRVAILTASQAVATFDQQGFRDIALTVKVK